jgi:CheY-like chemotaxis protein
MGNFTMEYTLIPVFGLIQETSREFRLSAKNKKVHFELENNLQSDGCGKDMDHFKVVGDRIRLAQVLRNLVSNALKFTPAEGKLVRMTLLLLHQSTYERLTLTKLFSKGKLTIRASMIAASTTIKDKHTLKTGRQISLKRYGTISIDVVDTGVGLSESQLERLFCDGTQFNVNELQSGQGSGLGLFISKGMVLQHGGDLQASSMGLGFGSTFTLELPLYVVPDEPEQATVTSTDTANMDETTKDFHLSSASVGLAPECSVMDAAKPEQPSHSQLETTTVTDMDKIARTISSLRILVVDDVASNRKLIARMAINRNHIVDQAENGREAVNRVVESMENGLPYDTILMDSQMPIMTGPDAVKQMRQMGCDSFIVGITGNVLTEDIRHFLSCGANDVLGKPVNFLKLEELWLRHGIVGSSGEETAKDDPGDFSV